MIEIGESLLKALKAKGVSRMDGRDPSALRDVKISRGYIKYAEGSVLIQVGDTHVVCTASVEDRVPPWLKGSGQGWITAEYGMLPRSTHDRNQREASRGKQSGRTVEIQRLIGRALRSVVDLSALGEKTVTVDCDVIQADGGTRTASITGGFVALVDALSFTRILEKSAETRIVTDWLAAVSVGIVEGEKRLDLCYQEDSTADVDMNVVMTGRGNIVEIQGTAEGVPFSREDMDSMFDLAYSGIERLIALQKEALGEVSKMVGGGGRR